MGLKHSPDLDRYLRELDFVGTPARLPALPPAGRMNEKEFTRTVIALAQSEGWLAAHFLPSINRRGQWRTAVQGDGAGFPDVVLVRGGWILMPELKIPPNKPTPEQQKWIQALNGAHVFSEVWTPTMLPEIQDLLRGK